jgi:hypothetical protein
MYIAIIWWWRPNTADIKSLTPRSARARSNAEQLQDKMSLFMDVIRNQRIYHKVLISHFVACRSSNDNDGAACVGVGVGDGGLVARGYEAERQATELS